MWSAALVCSAPPALRDRIGWLWGDMEWDWFTNGGQEVLYWHWSPNNTWSMNFSLVRWVEVVNLQAPG